MENESKIKQININAVDISEYKEQFCGCIVLTADNKILLQQRPDNWRTFPGCLSAFGGQVEATETPTIAIIRELKEELGADVKIDNLICLGVITEEITNHSELIYEFFWKDANSTITGCYECEPKFYNNVSSALQHPKIMDDVRWMLHVSQHKGLLNEI